MPLFDRYIIADWSAASKPKRGQDSIWVADLSREPAQEDRYDNPSTRHEAYRLLKERLSEGLAQGQRILAGFDFPFGYPRGTAARLRLAGPPWRALWDLLEAEITDADNNANNRFQVASALNRRLSGEAFPFWGCPARQENEFLNARKLRPHGQDDLPERRYADAAISGPHPVWKLYTTGSVGSQVLMGVPFLSRLRRDLAPHCRIWPFETGLKTPAEAAAGTRIAVFAEVYPSLWPVAVGADEVKDKAQVRDAARALKAHDLDGTLPDLLAGPQSARPDERAAIEQEEAWILGTSAAVTAAD